MFSCPEPYGSNTLHTGHKEGGHGIQLPPLDLSFQGPVALLALDGGQLLEILLGQSELLSERAVAELSIFEVELSMDAVPKAWDLQASRY